MKAPTSTVDTSPWYPPLAVRVSVTSRCTQTGPVLGQQTCNTSDSPVQPPNPTVSTHTQTPAANSLTLEWEANTSDRPPDLNDEWELHEALVEMVERTRRQEIQVRFYSLYSEWDGSLFEMLNLRLTVGSFIQHVSYIDMFKWLVWWPDPMLAGKRSFEITTKTLWGSCTSNFPDKLDCTCDWPDVLPIRVWWLHHSYFYTNDEVTEFDWQLYMVRSSSLTSLKKSGAKLKA